MAFSAATRDSLILTVVRLRGSDDVHTLFVTIRRLYAGVWVKAKPLADADFCVFAFIYIIGPEVYHSCQ